MKDATTPTVNELTTSRLVAQDWVDLRDLKYHPSLAVLKNKLLPDRSTVPCWPGFAIRHQGKSGRCVGFALANLVDLQRREQTHRNGVENVSVDDIVSADMLYWMAAYHDGYPDLDRAALDGPPAPEELHRDGVRSLRSVIKALYHHGVCRDHPTAKCPPDVASWQSDCYQDRPPGIRQLFPTVAQSKAARAISLGAYYRLEPVLNDYHAALNDTGGILVSAQVHDGWRAPFDCHRGVIGDSSQGYTGAHAFVIVGYDTRGFLVLNSWGDVWGGYDGLPGVALWLYDDWADAVMDGWVLRLGVSAPEAFDVTVGRRGLARSMGMIQAKPARCHQLIGHYLHLDDGFHVQTGSYPSDAETWGVTRDYLKTILHDGPLVDADARPRSGVMLWIPGSLEGIDTAVLAAVRRKSRIADLGLYPYNVFWCDQFVEKSLEVMKGVFDSCHARIGALGPQLDALIEMQLQGIGRAFWRDIEQAARRAVHGTPDLPEEFDDGHMRLGETGPLVEMFRDMLDLVASQGIELHVVCEGAGVLVLHELLRYFCAHDAPCHAALAARMSSLSLIHPAIGLPRAKKHLLPLLAQMNGESANWGQSSDRRPDEEKRNSRSQPPARIYLAAPKLEERLCFGVYSGSLLRLVSRSFEDRLAPEDGVETNAGPGGRTRARTHPSHPPRPMLGMSQSRKEGAVIALGDEFQIAFSELKGLRSPEFVTGRVPNAALHSDPQITDEVLLTIRGLRSKRAIFF